MRTLLVAIVLACGQVESAQVDGDQFLALLKSAHSALTDISFIYEGEMEWTGPLGLIKNVHTFNRRFQGFYAYRTDGAILMDVYVHRRDPGWPYQRWMASLLGDRHETMKTTPDAEGSRAPIKVVKTRVGSFSGVESPLFHFFFNPYFDSISDPAAHHFAFDGWDTVDGHQCLRVKLDLVPTARGKEPNKEYTVSNRYWLDMARGGNPIRIQNFRGSHLAGETSGIELVRHELPGGLSVWVPMGCRHNQYEWADEFHSTPVYRINHRVVSSSIVVNQKLPDSFFSVKQALQSNLGALGKARRVLESMGIRKEFEAHQTTLALSPRTDRRSMEANLKSSLRKAEKQARMLEASSAARSLTIWPLILQVSLILLGAALCVRAGYVRYYGPRRSS